MKTRTIWGCLILFLGVISCSKKTTKTIGNVQDYNTYLKTSISESKLLKTKKNCAFWKTKYDQAPNQFVYLGKLATNHTKLFELTGTIEYLKNAENYLVEAINLTDSTQVSFLHSLAVNYISQHRFKACLPLLKKARQLGEKTQRTKQILFDVFLELGNDSMAKKYLDSITNSKDFNYLIRRSKWEDKKGNLSEAINYLKLATKIAENAQSKPLKIWSYSNLGDFYGHSGNIEQSYDYYLKTLAIDSTNTYVLKKIAWIKFSHEKNSREAHRILDSLLLKQHNPDPILFKMDLAKFDKDSNLYKTYESLYFKTIANPNYGDMYNAYTINIWTTHKNLAQKAIAIALKEVENRPSVQSYDLLAWSYLKSGNIKKAFEVNKKYVLNKSFEPVALYHTASILKAHNVDHYLVKELKKELNSSAFEIGPLILNEVNNL